MTRDDVVSTFAVSRETLDKLDFFAAELKRWQAIKNLVGPATINDLWGRHFADSLQLWDIAPAAKAWLDLGSGAGLPGLVIAIRGEATGANVTLIEANSRKCAFLREMARKLSLPVTIREGRLESIIPELNESFDVVTARALASLPQLLDWTYPLLKTGVAGVFPKGADVANELTESRKSWRFNAELTPSRTDPKGRVLTITSVTRTPTS